jgi:hypothetical protein
MNLLFDSFWRAVAYCLHPRVIVLSILPLVVMAGITGGLGYFFWEAALDSVGRVLESSDLIRTAWSWLEGIGFGQLKTVLAPVIVIAGITPLVVIGSLLVVAFMMTPMIVQLVARRRFADLERMRTGGLFRSFAWTLAATLLALLAMVVSTPLWLVPPLVAVVPPLIWGWLTYRIMAYDALAEHASVQERHTVFREHRLQLMGMGLFVGYLGAAPSLIWSLGVMTIVMAPILVPLSIWLYTLIFAFSSLWFSHYALAALQALRDKPLEVEVVEVPPSASEPVPALVAVPVEAP